MQPRQPKLKPKHWQLGNHYARFIDRRWHPNFILDAATLKTFIHVESYGKKDVDADELANAEPLFLAKKHKELTIKMLFEEMADWWSMSAGWYYPIAHTLYTEFWREGGRDTIQIKALVKIMRSCHRDTFLTTLLSFTGLSDDDKSRYCARWLAYNP